MPDISVEIEVYCSCGEGLCGQTTTGRTRGRGQEFFTVEPCKKCLGNSEDAGYKKGYEKACEEFEDKEG